MNVSTDSIDQKVHSILSKYLEKPQTKPSSTVSKSVAIAKDSSSSLSKVKDVGEMFNQIVGKIESKYTPLDNQEKLEHRTTSSFLASKSLNLSSKLLPKVADDSKSTFKPSPSKRVNFDIINSMDTSPSKLMPPNMPAATEYFSTTTTPTKGILKQTKEDEQTVIPQEKQEVKKLRNESEKIQKQIEKEKKELEKLKEIREIQQKALEDETLMKQQLEQIRLEKEKLLRLQEKKKDKMLNDILLEWETKQAFLKITNYFSIWRRKCSKIIIKLKEIEVWTMFRSKFRAFSLWKKFIKMVHDKRLEDEMSKQLKKEKEMNDLAHKFSRLRALSRIFVKWLYLLKVKREQRLLELQHEKNKKKMEMFLEQLNQKSAQQQIQQQQQELNQLQQQVTQSPPSVQKPIVESTAQVVAQDSSAKKKKEKISPEKTPTLAPKFLQTMEERSKQRKERWEQLQRKYKTMEEEKEKLKDEEQLKILAEEQAKKDEKKREKLLLKQKEIEKEKEKIDMKNKSIKAAEHYQKSIVKFYGFLPWKKLLRIRILLEKTARAHFKSTLLRKAFKAIQHCKYVNYNTFIVQQCAKVALLKKLCNTHILEKLFKKWYSQLTIMYTKYDRSVKLYDQLVTRRHFLNWKRVWIHEKEMKEIQEIEQERKARANSIRFTKRFYLIRWKESIDQAHAMKEKEQIGAMLREKVKQWLQEFRFQHGME